MVDHGSTDATLHILKALHAEGLRLVVLRNDLPGYLQAEITTSAARHAFDGAAPTRSSRSTPMNS